LRKNENLLLQFIAVLVFGGEKPKSISFAHCDFR
jgi:hypothetical protein